MKKIVITGASGGIGLAIARALVVQGHILHLIAYKNKQVLVDFKKNHPAYQNFIHIHQGDLTDEKTVDRIFSQIEKTSGPVDVLINAIGITQFHLLQEVSLVEWQNLFHINMESYFICTKRVLDGMIQQQSGNIINIASIWGEVGAAMEVPYASTKGAILSFTRALAKEVGPSGIRVNAISPGIIATDMNAKIQAETLEALCQDIPVQRIGHPDDVAHLAAFLVSDQSTYITGQDIGINGGWAI